MSSDRCGALCNMCNIILMPSKVEGGFLRESVGVFPSWNIYYRRGVKTHEDFFRTYQRAYKRQHFVYQRNFMYMIGMKENRSTDVMVSGAPARNCALRFLSARTAMMGW